MDLRGPYKPTLKGNRYWMMIVDDFSQIKSSKFIKYKSDLKKELCDHIELLNKNNKKVKYVRMDNEGENIHDTIRALQMLNIKVELTPPHSPQYNGVVERHFAIDREKYQEMLIGDNLKKKIGEVLWAESISTNEKIINASMSKTNMNNSPYETYHGEK